MNNESNYTGLSMSVAVAALLAMSSAAAYEAFHGPTELVYSDPDKAADGYLLFAGWARAMRNLSAQQRRCRPLSVSGGTRNGTNQQPARHR